MNSFLRRLLNRSDKQDEDDREAASSQTSTQTSQDANASTVQAEADEQATDDSAYAPPGMRTNTAPAPSPDATDEDKRDQDTNTGENQGEGEGESIVQGQDDDTAITTQAEAEAATNAQDLTSAQTAPLPAGVTRPLPSEPVNIYQPHSGHLVFGQSSDQGMVRNNNQDAAISFFFTSDTVDKHPDFGLFVVADGMGGHNNGEKASALTARVIAGKVLSDLYLPMVEQRYENSADQPTISEALSDAVKQANRMVLNDIPEAGTTLTAIVIMGSMAHIAHVGDSRAYLVTSGKLEQITRDHSLVQRLIELNQITYEESLEHPQRNVLYRAIGQSPDLEVDTLTRRLPADAYVLICSDGLWSLIEESEILETLKQYPDPQDACNKLVARANENGGHDNITAVIIKTPTS